MEPDAYRAFTHELTQRLRGDDRAIGLVAVGSMADRDYAPDEWSDHDFFIRPPRRASRRPSATTSMSCPDYDRVSLSFRETEHGLVVIYDDGHLLEFAVFDLGRDRARPHQPLPRAARPWRGRGACRARRREPARRATTCSCSARRWSPRSSRAGRGRRGETLSAAFALTSATTYLNRLGDQDAAQRHPVDPRRASTRSAASSGSTRSSALGVAAIVRLDPADGGPALLDLLERELRPLRPELPWPAFDAVKARLQPAD